MEKLEALIKRMKEDGHDTVAVRDWNDCFLKNIGKCREKAMDGKPWVMGDSYAEAEQMYGNIYGFLWALASVGYITGDAREECSRELMESFKSIPESIRHGTMPEG